MQTKQMGKYVKKTVARKNWPRLAARGSWLRLAGSHISYSPFPFVFCLFECFFVCFGLVWFPFFGLFLCFFTSLVYANIFSQQFENFGALNLIKKRPINGP